MAHNPDVVVIDYMEGVRILIDRYKQYKLVEESDLAKEGLYSVILNHHHHALRSLTPFPPHRLPSASSSCIKSKHNERNATPTLHSIRQPELKKLTFTIILSLE